MKTGSELIAEERQRQIDQEKYLPEHDDCHDDEALAMAASCYLMPQWAREFVSLSGTIFQRLWPFDDYCWKPSPENRIRELVKAGALAAAEIDRLQRARK